MQSKKHSLIETMVNFFIGYITAVLSQVIIFPMFGIYISVQENLTIAIWFSVIAMIRRYIIRRWFTKRTEMEVLK